MTNKPSSRQSARDARRLAETATSGALATVRRGKSDGIGHPYVSKVGVCLDTHGAPLFLFSTLAAHTQDLIADHRASLLLEAPMLEKDAQTVNPLELARTTLVGKIDRIDSGCDDQERAKYLACHPSAQKYANFGDFSLWRMTIEKIHYVGGFGLSKWVKAADYLGSGEDSKA